MDISFKSKRRKKCLLVILASLAAVSPAVLQVSPEPLNFEQTLIELNQEIRMAQ